MDTCALIGLAKGTLPRAIGVVIQEASRRSGAFVSAISALEVAQKAAKGKPTLAAQPRRWFPATLSLYGLRELPVSHQRAVGAYELPAGFHADPADRIIVATARRFAFAIVTTDQRILRYAAPDRVETRGY